MTFPDKYEMKEHRMNENNIGCAYQASICALCIYSCFSKERMEEHLNIHNNRKPWKCNLCDQRFRQKTMLMRHQHIDHNTAYMRTRRDRPKKPKIHWCQECDVSFVHEGNLKSHISKHITKNIICTKGETIFLNDDLKAIDGIQDNVKQECVNQYDVKEVNVKDIKHEIVIDDIEDGDIVQPSDPLEVKSIKTLWNCLACDKSAKGHLNNKCLYCSAPLLE